MMKLGLVLLAVVVGSDLRCARAQTTGAQVVTSPTPVLIELFTSEGCSSCPPADALLATLDGKVSPSGQQIIALEEHVTYWNQLGWIDPFSLEFFSERQNAYSENTGRDEVYTPQVVVNGVEQALGSDRNGVLLAVRMQGKPMPLAVNVLGYAPNGNSLSVKFTVSGVVPRGGADVFAVLADDADTTKVPRGENAGRTLMHVAVARSVGRGTVLREGDQTVVGIPLPQALRGESLRGRRVVLVVQLHEQGRVIGLATQELGAGLAGDKQADIKQADGKQAGGKSVAVAGSAVAPSRTLETR